MKKLLLLSVLLLITSGMTSCKKEEQNPVEVKKALLTKVPWKLIKIEEYDPEGRLVRIKGDLLWSEFDEFGRYTISDSGGNVQESGTYDLMEENGEWMLIMTEEQGETQPFIIIDLTEEDLKLRQEDGQNGYELLYFKH